MEGLYREGKKIMKEDYKRQMERNILTDAINNSNVSYIDISRTTPQCDFRDLRLYENSLYYLDKFKKGLTF